MQIDPKRPTYQTSVSGGAARRPGAGGTFSVGGEASPKAGGVAAPVSLGSMDALLALQGETDVGERRRRTIKRGRDLLDALDRLKAGLLDGRVSGADLKRLAATLRETSHGSGDPGLDGLLAQIELRAEVEIAKLSV